DSVYPYISSTGNFDIQESAEFLWNDEEVDVRVDNLTDKIRAGTDFADHLWESVEATENIDENSSPTEFDDSESITGIRKNLEPSTTTKPSTANDSPRPTIINKKLLDRVVQPREWLGNEDIDGIMYIFRENTTLRRWKPARVDQHRI
ncbi:unnamed protein product, partial [Thlaspi arvense]